MLLVRVLLKVSNWLGKFTPHLSESGSCGAISVSVTKLRCCTGWLRRKMSTPASTTASSTTRPARIQVTYRFMLSFSLRLRVELGILVGGCGRAPRSVRRVAVALPAAAVVGLHARHDGLHRLLVAADAVGLHDLLRVLVEADEGGRRPGA